MTTDIEAIEEDRGVSDEHDREIAEYVGSQHGLSADEVLVLTAGPSNPYGCKQVMEPGTAWCRVHDSPWPKFVQQPACDAALRRATAE